MNMMASAPEGDSVIPEILKGNLYGQSHLIPHRIALMRQMRASRVTLREIAEAFCIGITTVKNNLQPDYRPSVRRAHGIPEVPAYLVAPRDGSQLSSEYRDERDALIARLRRAGHEGWEIADALNISVATVWARLRSGGGTGARKSISNMAIRHGNKRWPPPSGHRESLPFRPADYCHEPKTQAAHCRNLWVSAFINALRDEQCEIRKARASGDGERIDAVLEDLDAYLRSWDGREILARANVLNGDHPAEHFIEACKDAVLGDEIIASGKLGITHKEAA